ncbi:hypothetical protein J3R83DRAFT_78 [Lanmaoa asiatica]|nr:hypothetical protein J3R83DRAFT_78 [Lanmaoa asiatica]
MLSSESHVRPRQRGVSPSNLAAVLRLLSSVGSSSVWAHLSEYILTQATVQATRCHRAHLVRSPEYHGSDTIHQPPSTAKEVVHLKTSQSPGRCAVHRVPPEILGIIFENCLDEQAPPHVVLSEPPLLLGRVCNYWRYAAQSTPRLWTSFSLRFLETDIDRSRDGIKVATAVETWLQRSYPAPLSIAFTDNRIYQRETEEVIIWLLSRIRMHAPRWKAIHLKFSSDYFFQIAVLSSCAFTSLDSFAVHIDHMGWRSGLLSLRLDLAQANRLTSLAYTGPDHVIREDILVDWARLTSVAFSYDLHEAGGESATLPRHFSTLAQCQNLTELSIGLSTTLAHLHQLDVIAQGQTMIPMIELPRLRTLRVRRLSRSARACALIDALRLPQLSTLDIDSAVLLGWNDYHPPLVHPDLHPPPLLHTQMDTQPHWWHAHHFSALLDRSACHLHALHIRDVDMSPSELSRLLTSPSTSPTLSSFTFEPCPRVYPMSDILTHFVSVPGSDSGPTSAPSSSSSPSSGPSSTSTPSLPSPSFPSLTKLRLGCAHETHLDSLADIVETRTGDRATQMGVHPLAVFELVFYDFVYSHGQGRQTWRKTCFDAFRERVLRCAREGGVDVDIRVERPYEPVYLPVP